MSFHMFFTHLDTALLYEFNHINNVIVIQESKGEYSMHSTWDGLPT